MSEVPTSPPIMKETPVLDPRAFVLHGENEAFLKGRRSYPYLSDGAEDLFAAFLAIVAFFCLMAGFWFFVTGEGQVFNIVAGVVLVLTGVGSLGVMVWSTRPKRRNTKLVGQVLIGEVLESEKIRGYRGEPHLDGIGVRYQFTTPGGKVIRDRAEATNDRNREKMAPAPESPVYIWYDQDGNYTLL